MKRGGWLILGLLLFSILFAAFSSAVIESTDKKIYDKWHYSGDTFTLEGEVFLVSHLRFKDMKMVLSINNKSVVISNGTCYETEQKKYCLMDIYNDVANADENDPIKFSGRFVYAGLNIEIYSRGSEVTATRTFTPASPAKNDEVTVEVTLKNPTDFWTESFYYYDAYPEGVFIISGSSAFEKTSKVIKYVKNLPPKSEQKFRYIMTVLDYISFTNYASVNYSLNGAPKSFNTTAFTVDLASAKPYVLTTSLSPASAEPTQDFTLTLSLKNKKGSKLNFKRVALSVPSQDLTFNYNPGTFDKSGSTYTWSGSIENGTTKDLQIRLNAHKTGKYSIPMTLEVEETATVSYIEKKDFNFTISFREPEIILSVREPTVAEGGIFRVALSVKNPNQYTIFKDVRGLIRSNISTTVSGEVAQIMPGFTKTIVIKEGILAPTVEVVTPFTITSTGKYDTATEPGKPFSKTGTVTVSPVNKSIFVTQSLVKPADLHIGDNITVTVNIRHSNEEIVKVNVKDTYSPGIKLDGGKDSANLYFDKASDQQAYIYSLVIPRNYTDTELFIKSEASIEGKPGLVTQMIVLSVNQTARLTPEEAEAAAKAAVANASSSSGNASANSPETGSGGEPGFFTKVVNGVTDFIKRLLGFE